MNKPMFLNSLRRALNGLPDAEIEKNLAYYSEMIDDRMEEGMTEIEAVASLEPVSVLAERAFDMYRMPPVVAAQPGAGQQNASAGKARPKKQRSTGLTVLLIILAVMASPIWLPLAAATLGILVAVAAGLLAVAVAVIAAVIGMAVGGVVLLFYCFFHAGVLGLPLLFVLGGCLMCIGLGVLLFFPAIALVKLLWRWTKAFFRWIGSLFKGRKGGR